MRAKAAVAAKAAEPNSSGSRIGLKNAKTGGLVAARSS